MDIAREDWLLVFIIAAAVLPFAWGMLSSDAPVTPETPVERYCVNLAADVEANASFAGRIDSCRCVPPDEVPEQQFQAPDTVENATSLFLVSCTLDNGEKQVFPVRRIREGYTGDLNRTNASVLGQDQR
ncbi:MAG: hypothetical protein SVW02_03545 [Candidatus Nanohaloarchaea archaeon]|nr:hypothetical protein [Candidatus Nanohaloarchaea archaeon]